jgi:Trk K+ transport system NAD-binding subunit
VPAFGRFTVHHADGNQRAVLGNAGAENAKVVAAATEKTT